ncbi:molybdopterin-guanine dinucleotide biosynthesis protein B [Neobacillus rhizophilus]|uniref:molybdopterin-guanine dinucleotide biosynthesis protein B n=1 Tax=Neobacillus rhizophilus TaxID=2833579 RepID=UPI0035574B2B
MALVGPVIFQVTGYQDSGKTTFIEKLLHGLKAEGLMTAVIKHHGHGGKPDVLPKKDSTRHLEAGAIASIVEGEGRLLLQTEQLEFKLDKQINLLGLFNPDIILVEGHKQESFPKMVLLRDTRDLSLIKMLKNIAAVVYWEEGMEGAISEVLEVPCFHIGDAKAEHQIVRLLKQMHDMETADSNN